MGESVTRRWPWYAGGPLDGDPLSDGAWREPALMAAPRLDGDAVVYMRTRLGVSGSGVRVEGFVQGESEAERVHVLWEKLAEAWLVPGLPTARRLCVKEGVVELLEREQRTVVLSVVDGRLTLEAKDDAPEPTVDVSPNGSG